MTSDTESIDPFSPNAQNQLAEFDLLRNQIESKDHVESNTSLATKTSNDNNGGKIFGDSGV